MKPKRLTLGIATPDFQFLAKNLFFPEQETLITARPQNPFCLGHLVLSSTRRFYRERQLSN